MPQIMALRWPSPLITKGTYSRMMLPLFPMTCEQERRILQGRKGIRYHLLSAQMTISGSLKPWNQAP